MTLTGQHQRTRLRRGNQVSPTGTRKLQCHTVTIKLTIGPTGTLKLYFIFTKFSQNTHPRDWMNGLG